LAAANSNAPVLLSLRDNSEAWWRSAHATIFEATDRPPSPEAGTDEWYAMVMDTPRGAKAPKRPQPRRNPAHERATPPHGDDAPRAALRSKRAKTRKRPGR
jgi:hypothetical protein